MSMNKWAVGSRQWAVRKAVIAALLYCPLPAAGCLLISGCAGDKHGGATTRPATTAQRQDAALKDPFGYSPGFDDSDNANSGVDKYDREGMRKDLDHVFNP